MRNAVVLGVPHSTIFEMAAAAQQADSVQLAGVYDENGEDCDAAAQQLKVPAIETLD